MNPRRILIVRLSAFGDVIHVLPALAALRRNLPDAHIAWIAESLPAQLLQGHPLLNELIVYPRARWKKRGYLKALPGDTRRFFTEMRRRRFDVAIDFQGLTKSALIPWLSAIPARIGYGDEDGREISRLFYTVRCRPPGNLLHVIRRNLFLLRPLGLKAEAIEFPLPDFSAERADVVSLLEKEGIDPEGKFVFLNPGAGWETKRWPPEYYGRLATLIVRRLERDVMFTWGPGEETLVEKALAQVEPDVRGRVHRAPPTNLRQLAALLERGGAMVGGDTGPVHLAAALGLPIVAIYGGSDPKRNGPLGRGPIRVLDNPDIECYPCWKTECDNPPPRCLTTIEPESVCNALGEVLRDG